MMSASVWNVHLMSGVSIHSALLDRAELKSFRPIGYLSLTECHLNVNLCFNVASHFILYHYFHINCSSKHANCTPSSVLHLRCTRLFVIAHPDTVLNLSYARINLYFHFSSLFLVIFGTFFFIICFALPMASVILREEH